jgi:Alpha galactosidase A/Alpha galactosidase C-terminal beta sandwich domain
MRHRTALAATVLLLTALLARPGGPPPAFAAANGVATRPYLGWSSWSMQSSHFPGLNPKGNYSWLNEANVLRQADAMATKLKRSGYTYVNIDAGWWLTYDWHPGFDQFGRETPNPDRFPHGMKSVADHIHAHGLKAGIYLPVGLEKPAYDNANYPIWNAPGCHTHDIVYPDKRTTNGWDSSYKIDFSQPCAQKYVDSVARELADWGYDFLKLDGVGPGSAKPFDANHDNRADVAAWSAALVKTGRPIHFELSWSLDRGQLATWQRYANGWRIDTDVECYCNTLVTWAHSVRNRWADVPAWAPAAGPGGWNDLDAVDVGNGAMDGITPDERQSTMTLWAISAAPLFTGDDLTQLDNLGLALLTNTEVIAVDQQGRPARQVRGGSQQIWSARNTDGTYTVALFNLGGGTATVAVDWTDLGFANPATVRDLWSHANLGTFATGFSAALPRHGSRLLRVAPAATGRAAG